jgi:hypothetical protein
MGVGKAVVWVCVLGYFALTAFELYKLWVPETCPPGKEHLCLKPSISLQEKFDIAFFTFNEKRVNEDPFFTLEKVSHFIVSNVNSHIFLSDIPS